MRVRLAWLEMRSSLDAGWRDVCGPPNCRRCLPIAIRLGVILVLVLVQRIWEVYFSDLRYGKADSLSECSPNVRTLCKMISHHMHSLRKDIPTPATCAQAIQMRTLSHAVLWFYMENDSYTLVPRLSNALDQRHLETRMIS
jgi:hypothetical protein